MNSLARLTLELRLRNLGFREKPWTANKVHKNPAIWSQSPNMAGVMIGLTDDTDPFVWRVYRHGRYAFRRFSDKARREFFDRFLAEEDDDGATLGE